MSDSTPRSTEDWGRISALLDDALALSADRRSRWLDALAPEDLALKSTLADLLARASAETDDFMRRPVRMPFSPEHRGAAAHAGSEVGPYRLLREIGAGGMGAVWLAERADGALQRRVALKLPKLSWDAAGLAARMARERDILAALEHPNIARLYDAGVDAQGRPYLAMEYVEGRPIDVYCNECGLDLRSRLAVFLQVARAVAHAHARLVVHRDLKPSNLLVSADGAVHLLDFGIAKLIEGEPGAESAGETHLTQISGRALTPDYAAPEQIRGDRITVAADIYSLAIVLFELVAGERPYRLHGSSRGMLDEDMQRLVPPLASAATKDRERATLLRGDLDTILAKAMKRAPAERYATVDAFAADVQRHLDGAAVLARPDTVAYRTSRFARRHKIPLALALFAALAVVGGAAPLAAVIAALAAGAAIALWQAGIARREAARAAEEARQAQRERDRALALAERNEASLEFLQIMLTESAPAGTKVSLNELLARSEELALRSLRHQPEQLGTVLDLMASAYTSLGDFTKAEELLRQAAEVVRTSSDVALRARIESNHGLVLSECGKAEIGRQMIEHWLSQPGLDDDVAALCEQYLAEIARNHSDAKGALLHAQNAQARLAACRRKSPLFEASVAGDLAFALVLNGRMDEADRQFAAAIEMHRTIGRQESPQAMAILNNWGLIGFPAGCPAEALARFDEVQAIAMRRSPDGSPPPYVTNNRASALLLLGRLDDALHEAERSRELADRAGAAAFALNARVLTSSVYRERGQLDEAQRLLDAAASMAAAQPEDSFAGVSYRYARALLAFRRGNMDEAKAGVESLIDMYDRREMRTMTITQALRLRAEIRAHEGDIDGAREDARRSLAVAQSLQATNPYSSNAGHAWLLIARLERATSTQAAKAASAEAVSHLRGSLGDAHPETQAARELAAALSAQAQSSP